MNIDHFELMILVPRIIPIFPAYRHYSNLPSLRIHCPGGNSTLFPYFPEWPLL
jgi:hypothetical protein